MALPPAPVLSQEGGDPEFQPLFRSHEALRLRIEADFKTIRRDRDDESEERPGTVYLIRDDGTEEAFPVQIRTRGRFRLESNTCQFPPLRINFVKGEVKETLFEGQDKVKLVTHCRDSDQYEQNTVKEYLVYRLYNVLTPYSLQARMAHITYVDTSGDDDTVERLGFFIEMEEAMAERTGGEILPDSVQRFGLHPARILSANASRVSLFQYMVGNTDFSMYGANGTPPHNAIPVSLPEGGIMPVPYDFDWTGFVGARYARPDPSLGTRSVRQRVFRGLCRSDVDYAALYATFLSHREAMTAIVRDEALLEEDEKKDALEYLDEFWETLENERNRQRRIEGACRPI